MSPRAKKPPRRRAAGAAKPRPRRKKTPAPAPEVEAFEQIVDAEVAEHAHAPEPPAAIEDHDPEVPLATPEIDFAARVPDALPDRPHPDRRRAIFFDVENTSRPEHIARVIEHLAVDRVQARTEFIAVGNWRVIGHDTARLLARHGAQLVHSAPSVGVRDWSDLRIAVAAGVWLASSRAGDVIELVSDDRAFDAVGDVAAGLGITFRRLSFRRLAGMAAPERAPEAAVPEAPRPADQHGRGRRRGRRGGRGREREMERGRPSHAPAAAHHAPAHPTPAPPPRMPIATNGEPAVEPHTAPHDEIVAVIQELIERATDRAITIDVLANALKSRGFRRTPGSPRLITRLRRIREITIDRAGRITLVDGAPHRGHGAHHEMPESAPPPPAPAVEAEEPAPVAATPHVVEEDDEPNFNRLPPPVEDAEEDEEASPGNERVPVNQRQGGQRQGAQSTPGEGRRRRRSRRGGRGRRHGRSGAPAAP